MKWRLRHRSLGTQDSNPHKCGSLLFSYKVKVLFYKLCNLNIYIYISSSLHQAAANVSKNAIVQRLKLILGQIQDAEKTVKRQEWCRHLFSQKKCRLRL